MDVFVKNGVEVIMPPMDKNAELNMERCAEFIARMIQKYGKEVMAEIKARDNGNIDREQG